MAAHNYGQYLGFQVRDNTAISFGSGTRLDFTSRPGDPMNINRVSRITIRVANLNQFRLWLAQKAIPSSESRITDPYTNLPATLIRLQQTQNEQMLQFVHFDNEFALEADSNDAHGNTAYRLQEVWLVVDSLSRELQSYLDLGLGQQDDVILQPLRVKAKRIALDRGELLFVQRNHLETADRAHLQGQGTEVIGVSVRIQNVQTADRKVSHYSNINYATTRYNSKSCVLIPPRHTHGLWLELARYSP